MSAIEAKYLIDMNKKLNSIKEIMTVQIKYNDWTDIQRIVNKGIGGDVFPIGTIITVPHAEFGNITFIVADHDSSNYNFNGRHVMTLISKNTFNLGFPQSYPYEYGYFYQEATNMYLELPKAIGKWEAGFYNMPQTGGGESKLFIKSNINSNLIGAESVSVKDGEKINTRTVQYYSGIDDPPYHYEGYYIFVTINEFIANGISFGYTANNYNNFLKYMNNTSDKILNDIILTGNPYFTIDNTIGNFYNGFNDDFKNVVCGRTSRDKFFIPSLYETNANYTTDGTVPLKLAERSDDKFIRLTNSNGDETTFSTETTTDTQVFLGGSKFANKSYAKDVYEFCVMCNIVG